MQIKLDCFPCYFRQALQAARFSTDDPSQHWVVMRAVSDFLSGIEPGENSILVAERVHEVIRNALADSDPYLKVKESFTDMAEKMLPAIEKMAKDGDDELLTAVKIAIAGNIIDFGAGGDFDVDTAIKGALNFSIEINHYERFKKDITSARTILYICDNTGEIYFDRPLLNFISDKNVTIVTRGGPSLNDATIEYAHRAGLDEFGVLDDTGLQSMGFPVDRIKNSVRDLFYSADVVIAKGQANFESLHAENRPALFFLMKVKCDLIAKLLHASFGDILVMESSRVPEGSY